MVVSASARQAGGWRFKSCHCQLSNFMISSSINSVHFWSGVNFIQKKLSKKSYPQISEVKILSRRVIQNFFYPNKHHFISRKWCHATLYLHFWNAHFVKLMDLGIVPQSSEPNRQDLNQYYFKWYHLITCIMRFIIFFAQ